MCTPMTRSDEAAHRRADDGAVVAALHAESVIAQRAISLVKAAAIRLTVQPAPHNGVEKPKPTSDGMTR